MLKNAALAAILSSTLLLAACETGAPENDGSSSRPVSTAAEHKPAPAPAPPPAAPAPAPSPQKEVVLQVPPVGMLECDQLTEKYKACLEAKVSGVSRVTLEHSLNAVLKQWHEIQDRGGSAAELLQSCQKTREQMRGLVAPYGCDI